MNDNDLIIQTTLGNIEANRNLTPAQRVWKRRRNRWAAWNASRGKFGRNTTWQQAVREGTEATFLKREGEGD